MHNNDVHWTNVESDGTIREAVSAVHKDKVREAAGSQAASFKLQSSMFCDLTLDLASPRTCAVSSIAARLNASLGSGRLAQKERPGRPATASDSRASRVQDRRRA